MSREIVAIVPARSGSKGVPKKNIRLLAGYPLLAYSIAAGALAQKVDRVVVSTDSEEIAGIARHYGADVPFLRPAKLAQDDSPDRDFVIHALKWSLENEGATPRYLVHLRPTTPLRDPALIDAAIAEILARPEATSLRSGHPAAESPFKWFSRNKDGYFEGINPNDPRPEYYNLPRQAFEPVFIPNGYVDILKVDWVLNSESLHGRRMIGFVTPLVREVDTGADFAFLELEFEVEKKGQLLWDYLHSHFPQGN